MEMEKEKPQDVQIENANVNDLKNVHVLEAEAQQAHATERSLSVRDAIRAYPMAIFWSLMVSMCVVMEGYDTIL